MRVIIEVDNKEELEEALAVLDKRDVTIQERPSVRQERLRELLEKYQGKLPEGYRFDRDEAHER